MGEAAIQINEGKRLDVEMSKVCFKLEFIAKALEQENHPAGEILSSITKELDDLLDDAVMLQSK